MTIKHLLFVIVIFAFQLSSFANVSNDIRKVAAVIYAEAMGESYEIKSLVATVMWVRADENPLFLIKAISIPKQFAQPIYDQGDKWDECMKLATEMYGNRFKKQSVILGNGVVIVPDHFFHGKAPRWAEGRIWRKRGGLKFLRLDSYRKVK